MKFCTINIKKKKRKKRWNRRGWNISGVFAGIGIFFPLPSRSISDVLQATPLKLSATVNDSLAWAFTKYGNFSSKTAFYQMLWSFNPLTFSAYWDMSCNIYQLCTEMLKDKYCMTYPNPTKFLNKYFDKNLVYNINITLLTKSHRFFLPLNKWKGLDTQNLTQVDMANY